MFSGRSSNKHNVAHLWASQSGVNGALKKNQSGSLHFDGATIFSYREPIARFFNPQTVFITSRHFSVTTSAHLSAVHQALHGLSVDRFHVPHVDAGSRYEGMYGHASNFDDYTKRINALALKAARARSNRLSLLSGIQSLEAERELYRVRFCGDARQPIGTVTTPEALAAAVQADAENAARRKVMRAEAIKQAEERDRIYAIQQAEKRDAWRVGKYNGYIHDGDTMLRVNGDVIETSRGARVPATVAPLLWTMVQRTRKANEGNAFLFRTDAEIPYRVGDFALREVTAEGDLVIGCHTLKYDELAKLAATLGLT